MIEGGTRGALQHWHAAAFIREEAIRAVTQMQPSCSDRVRCEWVEKRTNHHGDTSELMLLRCQCYSCPKISY